MIRSLRTSAGRMLVASLLAVLAACGGAASEEEAAAEDLSVVYNDMADVLEGVTDSDSLESAKSDMRDLAERMKELRDQYEGMAMDSEAQAKFSEAVSQDLQKAQQRMTAAMMKVGMNPKLTMKFQEVMKEFGDAFDKP